ncbi:MAG TPA: glycosyl hydrolase [Abditibacteriaceae bacterium]
MLQQQEHNGGKSWPLSVWQKRRHRRLEVHLPVWLKPLKAFHQPQPTAWMLGYTRDVSVEGADIVVPHEQESHWRAVAETKERYVLRYDLLGLDQQEYITGYVGVVHIEPDTNNLYIDFQYEEGSEEARNAAYNAGMKHERQRRIWKLNFSALALIGMVLVLALGETRVQTAVQQQKIQESEAKRRQNLYLLSSLSQPRLAINRAQGYDELFHSRQAKAVVGKLTARALRWSDPDNRVEGEKERARQQRQLGIRFSGTPSSGVRVKLGVALPYGYAWPQVCHDVEELIGRRIPSVVLFRDFKQPFPLQDCREAQARGKSLQITWEPWHWSNPNAVKLQDIAKGKYDRYIDSWAQAAMSFGNDVWIRWGHEFNGNWYPWSLTANGKNGRLYIAAYRRVHDRFRRIGASNVRWIWCVNASSVPEVSWNNPLIAYPGDEYVDMIAIDGYNFGTALPHSYWRSFDEIFARPYAKLAARFPRKPLMIGEIGSARIGGDKAAWIRDMDRSLRQRYPRIQQVVWFEAMKEADWRMVSPEALPVSRKVWSQNFYMRGVF